MRTAWAALVLVSLVACKTSRSEPRPGWGAEPSQDAGQQSDAERNAVRVAEPATSSRRLLPPSVDFTLGNGVRVFLVEDHRAPLVSVEVRVAGGSVEDPAGKEGAASLVATLLGKGAGSRDAATFQEAVDFVGGTFGTGSARRWLTVAAEFPKEHAALEMELVADALMRPHLAADEFEKERRLAIDGIRQEKQQPRDIVRVYHAGWFYGAHPYAKPPGGDENSLASLTLEHVKAAARRALAPSRTWIAVAGDFDPAAMRSQIEARFGGWDAKGAPPATVPPVEAPKGRGLLLVDFPTSLQTYFRFGQLGFDWKDPDYPARYLANTILGGRFTSRLNQKLRTETGLTYGAGSSFDDSTQGTFFVASYTEVDRGVEAMDLAQSIVSKFLAEGMTQEEFDSARAYVKGQYAPNAVETASQVASMILALEFDGVPRAVVSEFFDRLDALTLEGVNRVVTERLPDSDWVWTVIGPAARLGEFARKFANVKTVPLQEPGFGR